MAGLGDLVVKLSLDAAGFESGIDDAAYHAQLSSAKIVAAGNIAANAVTAFAKVAVEGISDALRLLPEIATQVFEQVDRLDEAATSVGVRLENFQKLQAAFALGGVNADQFATGLGKLNQAITQAAAGEKVADTFAKLGVSVQDANGELRNTDDVLRDVADAFKDLPEGPERSAIAMELFGKAGRQFIPGLVDDLDELGEHAEKVGAIFSDELVAASHDYELASAQLDQTLQGVRNTIAEGLLPVMSDFKSIVDEGIQAVFDFQTREEAAAALTVELRGALQYLATVVALVVDIFVNFKDILADVVDLIILLIKEAGDMIVALKAAFTLDISGFKAAMHEAKTDFDDFLANVQQRAMREQLYLKVKPTFERVTEGGDFDRAFDALGAEAQRDAQASLDMYSTVGGTPSRKQKGGKTARTDDKEYQARLRLALQEGKAEEEAHRDMLKRTKQMDDEAAREMDRDRKEQEKKAHDHAKALAEAATKAYEEQKRINQQWQDLFVNPLSDAFVSLIEGTKSVKDAIADMAKSIAHSIDQIISKQIATGLVEGAFGGPNPETGGGIGGFFSGLFGGGRALGGAFQSGQAILVGERGPEWIKPNFAGSVEPSSSSSTTHNNVSIAVRVPPMTDRRSADQIGASVGLAVNRALQRTQ